jgi:ketosteroid isomerase-like protein
MSEETVALVRTLFEAFLRRDGEVMQALVSSEVEWDATDGASLLPPEWVGVHRGAEEGGAFWRAWISSWQDMQFDYELRDAGDQVVVGLVSNQRQWGRQSGVETEFPPYAWVYTVRDGRVVKGRFYPDHESALQAHGLAE